MARFSGTLLALLLLVLTSFNCAHALPWPPTGSAEEEWVQSLMPYGVYPFFPLTEDYRLGNVFLLPYDPDEYRTVMGVNSIGRWQGYIIPPFVWPQLYRLHLYNNDNHSDYNLMDISWLGQLDGFDDYVAGIYKSRSYFNGFSQTDSKTNSTTAQVYQKMLSDITDGITKQQAENATKETIAQAELDATKVDLQTLYNQLSIQTKALADASKAKSATTVVRLSSELQILNNEIAQTVNRMTTQQASLAKLKTDNEKSIGLLQDQAKRMQDLIKGYKPEDFFNSHDPQRLTRVQFPAFSAGRYRFGQIAGLLPLQGATIQATGTFQADDIVSLNIAEAYETHLSEHEIYNYFTGESTVNKNIGGFQGAVAQKLQPFYDLAKYDERSSKTLKQKHKIYFAIPYRVYYVKTINIVSAKVKSASGTMQGSGQIPAIATKSGNVTLNLPPQSTGSSDFLKAFQSFYNSYQAGKPTTEFNTPGTSVNMNTPSFSNATSPTVGIALASTTTKGVMLQATFDHPLAFAIRPMIVSVIENPATPGNFNCRPSVNLGSPGTNWCVESVQFY